MDINGLCHSNIDGIGSMAYSDSNDATEMNTDEKRRLFKILDSQSEQLDRLEVGMYGDEKNKIKGVIERLVHVEHWITKANLKIAMVTGIFTAMLFALKLAWDYITAKK